MEKFVELGMYLKLTRLFESNAPNCCDSFRHLARVPGQGAWTREGRIFPLRFAVAFVTSVRN
jgi:hypothetical protein